MFERGKPIIFALFVTCLCLGGAVSAFGQMCPTIEITRPPNIVRPGDSFEVSAVIKNDSGIGQRQFSWSVNKGVVVAGKTPDRAIVLTTRDLTGQSITLSVKVSGVSSGCNDTATESVGIMDIAGCCSPIDDFGADPKRYVIARIDNLFIHLERNANNWGFIIIDFADDEPAEKRRLRIRNILDAIAYRSKVPPGYDINRITFFIPNKSSSIRTRFYILSHDFDERQMPTDGEVIPGAEIKRRLPTLFNNN